MNTEPAFLQSLREIKFRVEAKGHEWMRQRPNNICKQKPAATAKSLVSVTQDSKRGIKCLWVRR